MDTSSVIAEYEEIIWKLVVQLTLTKREIYFLAKRHPILLRIPPFEWEAREYESSLTADIRLPGG